MITSKNEYSIRSDYPVPEDRKSPLDLLIAKEEPLADITFDVEIVIFLADFAARFPEKWLTVKEKVMNGRASINDLALRLKINRRTVLHHLEDLRLEAKKWGGGPFVDYSAKINEADGAV